MLNAVVGLLVALLALPFSAVAADDKVVVGSAVADATGKGSINVDVNSSLEPNAVAADVRSNVELTNEAKPDVVEPDTVQEGTVRIDFSQAPPGSTVEAILSEATRRRILAGAAGGAIGGISTAALIGAGAVLVTGGVVGGLAASGEFSSNQKPATVSR